MQGVFSRRARTAIMPAVLTVLLSAAARADRDKPHHPPAFLRTNLVSDLDGVALNTDPNLLNPWGIAINPNGAIWIADNHAGVSTVYDAAGNPLPSEANPLVVTIPPPNGSPAGTMASPTGAVLNPVSDFVISAGGNSAPARFLFATEDGTVSGWAPSVNRTNAILVADNSASGAIYKGLALGHTATGNHIYLANFHAGTVDVLDSAFKPVTLPNGFMDPNIPAGFAPFNIVNIGGALYVTYAKQDENAEDDTAGPGNGYIDIYSTEGVLMHRFASNGVLNSPWGMAVVPGRFGSLEGSLLVGNFGDGRINVFDLGSGASRGPLMDSRGKPIAINGLWGLEFGPSSSEHGHAKDATLFFTAGLAHEDHGLFGTITVTHGMASD